MTITLQPLPRSARYEIRMVEMSEVQRSSNGVALPINRPGDHFEIEIDVGSLPTMCARELTTDVRQGRGQRLRVPLPQQDIKTGAVGVTLVDGDDQSGSSIDIKNGGAQAVIRKGWHVTIVTDGIGRLYEVRAETIIAADGTATLPIWPMLRVPPADDDVVEISEPFIEGYRVSGGELGMTNASRAGYAGTILIEEQD